MRLIELFFDISNYYVVLSIVIAVLIIAIYRNNNSIKRNSILLYRHNNSIYRCNYFDIFTETSSRHHLLDCKILQMT